MNNKNVKRFYKKKVYNYNTNMLQCKKSLLKPI
jgi:hypothetical protein